MAILLPTDTDNLQNQSFPDGDLANHASRSIGREGGWRKLQKIIDGVKSKQLDLKKVIKKKEIKEEKEKKERKKWKERSP